MRIKKEASGYLKFHLRRTINEKFLRAGRREGKKGGRRREGRDSASQKPHTAGSLRPISLPPPSLRSLPITSITNAHPLLVHATLHHQLPFPGCLHASFITSTHFLYTQLPLAGCLPLPLSTAFLPFPFTTIFTFLLVPSAPSSQFHYVYLQISSLSSYFS